MQQSAVGKTIYYSWSVIRSNHPRTTTSSLLISTQHLRMCITMQISMLDSRITQLRMHSLSSSATRHSLTTAACAHVSLESKKYLIGPENMVDGPCFLRAVLIKFHVEMNMFDYHLSKVCHTTMYYYAGTTDVMLTFDWSIRETFYIFSRMHAHSAYS